MNDNGLLWVIFLGVLLILVLCSAGIANYALVIRELAFSGDVRDKELLAVLVGESGGGFVAVAATIFGILITGIFLFMTFRIDQGAKLEAERTAKAEAANVIGKAEAATEEAHKTKDAAQKVVECLPAQADAAVERATDEQLASLRQEDRAFALGLVNTLSTRFHAHLVTMGIDVGSGAPPQLQMPASGDGPTRDSS